MQIRDITLKTPEENILYDEVLLSLAEEERSGETLRFWESKEPFVVLGRIGKMQDDVHVDQVRQKQIPVLRRSSGGGTVLQGQGCLNYSLILAKEKHSAIRDLKKSYQYILGKVIEALSTIGIAAVFMPISDIATGHENKKFSGNAQRRLKRYVLHHGTILYGFELHLIESYLKMPKDYPEYRRERPHSSFVTNIPITPGEFKDAMRNVFNCTEHNDLLSAEEKKHLNLLLAKKKVIINTVGDDNR